MMMILLLLLLGSDYAVSQDICGEQLLQIPAADIFNLTTPYYPDKYPNSADCTWIAQAPEPKGTLTVLFPHFDLETKYDYLTIGQGDNRTDETMVLRLTGKEGLASLSVNGEAVWIRFASDRGVAWYGFFLQIIWSPDTVPCKEGEFECGTGYGCLLASMQCDTIPQCLDESDESDCNFCGQQDYPINSTSVASLHSPNYPDIYYNDLDCFWHITAPLNGSILMTLKDFDTEEHYDFLTIWEGNSTTDTAVVLSLSGQSFPSTLSVISSEMWVGFQSDKGYGTRGFLLEFEWSPERGDCATDEFLCSNGYGCLDDKLVCDSVPVCYDESDEDDCQICDPEHYNLSFNAIVNLTSPFYPSIYPENWECIWFISAVNDGFPVFTFVDMDTEKYNDPLYIGYGENFTYQNTTLLELFGELEKSVIWFGMQTLWMRFKTNHRVGARGFLIHMTLQNEYECGSSSYRCESGLACISAGLVCDGYTQCLGIENDESQCYFCGDEFIQLSADSISSVNLTSPLYPKPYPTSFGCKWLITAKDNGTTIIRFIYFDTKLDQHYFQVGNGLTPSPETSVFRHSGQNMPKTVTVDGSDMWIEFASDHEKSQTGFVVRLEWAPMNSSCDGNDYVCPTSRGQVCLYGSDQCDGVELCPGLEDEQGCDYCGNEYITLTTDSIDTVNLSSPFYPNQYPRGSCSWFVLLAGNETTILTFKDFHTETQYDYLYLGYGDTITEGSKMLTLVGNMAPKTFQVEIVGMWIEFTSKTGLLSTRGFYVTLEADAMSATCEEGDFPCEFSHGKVCLHSYQECDGIPICPGRKDEKTCGICGQRYITLKPGDEEYELLSNNYPKNYRNDIACTWRVTSSTGYLIMLDILDFDVERGYDHVIIGYGEYSTDEASRVADLTGNTKLRRLLSMEAKLWIQFNTDRTGTRRGFHMLLSEINMNGNNDTVCDQNHIDCNSGLCVDLTAKCDGFNDCFNLQDEQNCANITCPGSYLCDESINLSDPRMCVPWDIVCDGNIDCPTGDDETECDSKRCPDGCTCAYEGTEFSELLVKCGSGWSTDTMQSLPRVTHTLELTGGNIHTLESGAFKEVPRLVTLSLIQNNISVIRQRAFDGLSNLTWLDLSENGISQIGSNIFEELKILDGLFLWSVPITRIRSGGFNGLEKLQTLVMVTEDETDEPIEVEKNGFTGLTSLYTLYVDDHRLCCHFNDLPDCITLEPQPPLFMCGSLMQNTGLRICMWVLGISALLGNFFVIIWRLKQKTTRSNTQAVQSFLITNLAVSDFLMGTYMVILASADAYFGADYFLHSDKWRAGKMCKFAGFLSLLSSEASVFFLTLISIDRFLSVVFPFSSFRLTIMSAKVIGGALWGVAFIISIVPVILAGPDSDLYDLSDVCIGLPLITRPASYNINEGGIANPLSELELALPVAEESKPAWIFSIIIFLGINLLCFFLILCCYIGVFVSLKVSAKKVRRRKRDEEMKLAVRMAIIVGTDFVCWMPIILMGILSQTGAAVIPLQMYTWTVVLILPINSSLNPYLYTIAALVSKRHFKVSPEDANAASVVKPNNSTSTQNTYTTDPDSQD